jgi:hypothetical protein
MGPLLAALIVLPIIGSWPALKDLFRRIGLWRVGWVWYLIVLAGPVLLTLAAVRINIMLGAQPLDAFHVPDPQASRCASCSSSSGSDSARSRAGAASSCRGCSGGAKRCRPR